MPVRIQRFKLRLMRYLFQITHAPGKDQTTADALSRIPAGKPENTDMAFIQEVECFGEMCVSVLPAIQEVECFGEMCVSVLPATTKRLKIIIEAQKQDAVLQQVRRYSVDGWLTYEPFNQSSVTTILGPQRPLLSCERSTVI